MDRPSTPKGIYGVPCGAERSRGDTVRTARSSARFPVPATNVTCLAFGGPDLNELYITTARQDMSPADLERVPETGGVYRAMPEGVRGLPDTPRLRAPDGRPAYFQPLDLPVNRSDKGGLAGAAGLAAGRGPGSGSARPMRPRSRDRAPRRWAGPRAGRRRPSTAARGSRISCRRSCT